MENEREVYNMKWFKKKEVPEVEEYKLKDREMEKLSESFVSRDEKYIASLGNGYIMNYLANKSVKKGFAFITDKRVYFKGSCLSGTGKRLVKTNEERTVDVKNITGSGFTYHRQWGILIALFFSILVSIAGAIGGVWLSHEEVDISDGIKYSEYNHITSEKERDTWEELLDVWDELEWKEEDYYYTAYFGDEEYCIIRYNEILRYHYNLECYEYNEYSSSSSLDDSVDAFEEIIEDEIEYWDKGFSIQVKRAEILETIIIALVDILSVGLGISLVIVCCIGIKNYLLKRKTLFRIEYAGGCIAFNVSFYAKAEIDDFQKQLRRAKDMAEESNNVKVIPTEAPVEPVTQSSTADDLRKYAELLKEGLITQEEYDAMKKKVLGL